MANTLPQKLLSLTAIWLLFSGILPINAQFSSKISTPPYIRTSGTTRCLVVFVKFKSDSFGSDLTQGGAECLQDSLNSWPWNVNRLPRFTREFIDSVALERPTPGSLTDYFWQMSSGQFYLIGDLYPKLIVPWFGENEYAKKKGKGLAWLNRKILQAIEPEVDFRRYDTNPRDGKADMIFILYRLFSSGLLDGTHYQGKAFLGGFEPILLDGVKIDGKVFGSGITSDCYKKTAVKLIAHEVGHYLFGSGHRIRIGSFGLMGENGYSTMCAREREWLGWLEPRILTTSVLNDTLQDLSTTGDARKIKLNANEYLLLSNRQRISFFEQLIDEPCKQGELPATGLVISHIWGPRPDQFAIIPADGNLTGKGALTDAFSPQGISRFELNQVKTLKSRNFELDNIIINHIRYHEDRLIYDLYIERTQH